SSRPGHRFSQVAPSMWGGRVPLQRLRQNRNRYHRNTAVFTDLRVDDAIRVTNTEPAKPPFHLTVAWKRSFEHDPAARVQGQQKRNTDSDCPRKTPRVAALDWSGIMSQAHRDSADPRKEQRIRRDVQIEIREAVYRDRRNGSRTTPSEH